MIDDVSTLGGLEKLRGLVGSDADHLCKLLPKGIGETLADELENRHLDFVANFASVAKDENKESIELENQLLLRVGELEEMPQWMEAVEDQDVLEAGQYAFDNDQPMTDCPYDFGTTELDDWLRGWCSAKTIAAMGDPADFDDDDSDEYQDVDDVDAPDVSLDEL